MAREKTFIVQILFCNFKDQNNLHHESQTFYFVGISVFDCRHHLFADCEAVSLFGIMLVAVDPILKICRRAAEIAHQRARQAPTVAIAVRFGIELYRMVAAWQNFRTKSSLGSIPA